MNVRALFAAMICIALGGFAFLAAPPEANAQADGWSEEFRLSAETTTGRRVSTPSIAADGDNVYIVYRRGEIQFIKSTDRGKSWSDPSPVNPGSVANGAPAIARAGSRLIVVWPAVISIGNGMYAFQLFFSTSTDEGANWSAPTRITQTRDDALSPKLLTVGNQVLLTWMETPLSETLGSISLEERLDISPESIESIRQNQSGAQLTMRQVQSLIYVSNFSLGGGNFAPPQRVEQINSQTLPHVYNMFGPYRGSLFIVVNQNTDIKVYESEDNGQNWEPNFQIGAMFNTRMQSDVIVVDQTPVSAWIRRAPFERIPVNFETDISTDSGRSMQITAPHFVRATPKLAFADGDYHVAWEAGESEDSWIAYIRTDDTRPTSTVQYPDSPDITTRDMTFQWEGDDNISSDRRLEYSYKYGDENWTEPRPVNQATLRTPADGEYVFYVRAEDVAGNIQDPPAEFAFNTFKAAPDTQITNPLPEGSTIDRRSFTLEFLGEDNNETMAQLEYSARVDDGEWTPFAQGNSHTFTGLSNGEHMFYVRMRDARGNVEADPATYSINVEVGMELVLEAKPPEITNEGTLAFGWTATDDKGNPVSLEYRYRLDDNPEQALSEPSLELADLDEGRHEIILWGVDSSGDETPKVEYSWIVDRTPPETDMSYAKEFQQGFPVLNLSVTDPSLPDGANPGKPGTFEYRINDGEWTSFNHQGSTWLAPQKLAFYSWGYTMDVRAIDNAGNIDASPAMVDLRIWSRTNPLIFYPIVIVIVGAILYLLYTFMPRGGGRRSTMATPPPSPDDSASSDSFDSDFGSSDDDYSSFSSDDDYDSSYSFDDDDDKKKDDPYA